MNEIQGAPVPHAGKGDHLSEAYRRYIDTVNGRRWDELPFHMHDEIEFDGKLLTRAEFLARTESLLDAIPDFHWWVDMLVVDRDRVLARLVDSGTPIKAWGGKEFTHQPIQLVEYAMYRYVDGRIASADLVIDRFSSFL